jgi:hypothetical protein
MMGKYIRQMHLEPWEQMVIQRMVVRLIFQSQDGFSILIASFNDFCYLRLARTYSKNGGIATGGGRILNP